MGVTIPVIAFENLDIRYNVLDTLCIISVIIDTQRAYLHQYKRLFQYEVEQDVPSYGEDGDYAA